MRYSIFLTGGTGFFGKSILSMVKRGFAPQYRFTILSRDPKRFLEKNPEFSKLERVSFLAGDVRDFAFPAERFDAILHAATPAVTTLAPGEMRSIILGGTERVLEFARQCGAQKMMFTSSGAVYGSQPFEIEKMPEDFPCHPVTEYGIAKLEAEEMCKASGFHTLLPRCFAFTGVYLERNIHFAIGNFIRDALAGAPIVIKGDGTPFRSYLYADDLVEWLFTILEHGENALPYNVGSERGVSIADLARCVKEALNSNSPIEICQSPKPGAQPARYVPDTTRSRTLGCRENYSLKAAVVNSLSDAEKKLHHLILKA